MFEAGKGGVVVVKEVGMVGELWGFDYTSLNHGFRFQELCKAHGLGDWGRLKNNYLLSDFWDQTGNETIEDHL